MKAARPVRKGADGKSAPLTRGNSPAAYLTRCCRRAHGGLQADSGGRTTTFDAEVEERGGADGPERTRSHRQVHFRPGGAAHIPRAWAALRRHVTGARQALLPLEARNSGAVAGPRGKAAQRRGDRGADPSSVLPGLPRPHRRWRRGATDRHPALPQKAQVHQVRQRSVARRRRRTPQIPAQRLRQAPHEGLLRPADRRRGP